MKKIFLILIFFNIFLYAKTDNIESQPEIFFNYDKLKQNQEKFRLQVEFNKAILLLEKQEYNKAIAAFKDTSKLLKIPSFLNIGIAYFKLNQFDNALLYFNNIYEYKEAIYSNTYSYISACYYLYQIKKQRVYLETIIDITKKYKNLTEHSNRLVVDTYIILKEYKKALAVLDKMEFPMYLKKALLNLKLKNYDEAEVLLKKAQESTLNQKRRGLILWLMIYKDLKSNQIAKLLEHIEELNKRKEGFKVNFDYPLQIFFNKDKYSPKEYLNFITKLTGNRKLDFMFYFAPFIFSDSEEILYDSSKGFVFKNKQNVQSLDEMVAYNSKFIQIIKDDPILRVLKLKSFIKDDSNSYFYYNLALCYAQIYDFHNAFKYFEKAYKLNPGNKLYAVMTLISANIIGRELRDKDYIVENIKSKEGMYKYFGQKVYQIFFEPKSVVDEKETIYSNTIFYRALDYLTKLNANKKIPITHPLFVENYKDPLVYLIKSTIRRDKENDYNYFARLQDTTPLKINNNFLEAPLVVTEYYIDLLKAIGLFNQADLTLEDKNEPSYQRIKALQYIYTDKPKKSLEILDKLQKKYKLEDKYTMYLVVAAQLEDGRYNDALLQISLIKAILRDKDADFLTGVQLIQELKLNSASQYFLRPYVESLIDFKLLNFDELLESL